MKILLIAPAFYDYHDKIVAEAVRQGHEVVFFAERPSRLVYSGAKKLPPGWRDRVYDGYLRGVLRRIEGQRFDRVLLIRGEIVRPWFVQALRAKQPGCRFVMYQWDSLRVVDFSAILPLFDATLTFDSGDAEQLKLPYLPLFYVRDYRIDPDSSSAEHDLTFVGSYHEERYETLKAIRAVCQANGIVLEAYVYIAWIDYMKLKLTGKRAPARADVSFDKLSQKDIVDRYRRAASILDIENNKQVGLTMRTFEALATGRNLVTTNQVAQRMLPELASRIVTLQRGALALTREQTRHRNADSAELDKYSIGSWLQTLLAA